MKMKDHQVICCAFLFVEVEGVLHLESLVVHLMKLTHDLKTDASPLNDFSEKLKALALGILLERCFLQVLIVY